MSPAELSKLVAEFSRRSIALAAPAQKAQLSPLSAIILAVLAATTLLAALFAAIAFLAPIDSDATVSAPAWTPPTLAVADLAPPKPASADQESLSRPIFSKNRKPAPKIAKASTATAAEMAAAPPGLAINAIVKNKKTTQAFVTSSESPDGLWKRVGETVDSWTISAIERDGVVLTNGAQTARVKLYADPLPPAADGMPPPPTPLQ
ncbi:hypothetical protein OGR47_10785 [Methylocystis sp. MJC1]|jgi:hypothetical protein|uniref:hypothetical protein n=1 Tax=Methylocystis sp. MJC1 TaxID=2654282 RepID=UPI0013EAD633|nr:hypothetical protein [Methylocystis sp. MJC1]KAF2992329.1 hypothetical protein MJC1_00710 [Methylocystis sp. MJC1]MBU6527467.1 hypothetical protein [Methylocystis sp. MJC1]UZX10413.1 hypothetical protein OGR47_10785 [Methylocystis sp. MJC1]